jgi:hypothetical protein
MCKEMPVIPVNRVVDKKRKSEKWKVEEERDPKKTFGRIGTWPPSLSR